MTRRAWARHPIHELRHRSQWSRYPLSISDTHRYVWFRVAKCGTRTIKSLLEELEGAPLPTSARFTRFDPASYAGYFKFAFVRSPYDRLVSCYFSKVRDRDGNRLGLRRWSPRLSFRGFVDRVCATPDSRSNRHYRSQHTLIDLESLDALGRLERFDRDVAAMIERLSGREQIRAPRLNTTGRAHYSHYYDEESRGLVGERYAEDLRLLGYAFEDRRDRPSQEAGFVPRSS